MNKNEISPKPQDNEDEEDWEGIYDEDESKDIEKTL